MADSKISELTAITEANLASDDVMPLVDTSATETKKITVSELDSRWLQSGAPNNPAGTDWIVAVEDFTHNQVLSGGIENWMAPFSVEMNAGGTGVTTASNELTTDTSACGIIGMTAPSSAGGFQILRTDESAIRLGVHTYRIGVRVRFEDVPDGTEDYLWWIGFSDNANTLGSGDYAAIGVFRADNATNFVVKTKDGTTENVSDTSTVFASDTWYTIEIELTPTSTSAYIDGVAVLSADTTNQPRSGANPYVAAIHAVQRIGSPSATRKIYYDWAYLALKPGSGRGTLGSGNPWS